MSPAPTDGWAAPTPLVPTIFHEPWWMRASCGGAEREAVVELGGQRVGRMPYLVKKRALGLTAVGMPRMAHVLGPALAAEFNGDALPRAIKQIALTQALIAQLPSASHVSFRLHGGVNNTLAFDAAGFTSAVEFTVEILPDTPEAMWRNMRDKTRNVIRRAAEKLTVKTVCDSGTFMDFYDENLRVRSEHNIYDGEICRTIIDECVRRDVGRVLCATDAAGGLHACIFTVWDHRREYYFMSTRAAGSMNGAVSLLIWTAIQHAAARGLIFDMDQVHVKDHAFPNLLLLTGFGGSMEPRFFVRRSSRVIQLGTDVLRLVRR